MTQEITIPLSPEILRKLMMSFSERPSVELKADNLEGFAKMLFATLNVEVGAVGKKIDLDQPLFVKLVVETK